MWSVEQLAKRRSEQRHLGSLLPKGYVEYENYRFIKPFGDYPIDGTHWLRHPDNLDGIFWGNLDCYFRFRNSLEFDPKTERLLTKEDYFPVTVKAYKEVNWHFRYHSEKSYQLAAEKRRKVDFSTTTYYVPYDKVRIPILKENRVKLYKRTAVKRPNGFRPDQGKVLKKFQDEFTAVKQYWDQRFRYEKEAHHYSGGKEAYRHNIYTRLLSITGNYEDYFKECSEKRTDCLQSPLELEYYEGLQKKAVAFHAWKEEDFEVEFDIPNTKFTIASECIQKAYKTYQRKKYELRLGHTC